MSGSIRRDQLGALSELARGGQGVVYDAPAVSTKFAASMVYKEYTAQSLRDMNAHALAAMPGFLEQLPYDDGARLISLAAWPCKTVTTCDTITGFIMPKLPDEFFIPLTTAKGTSSALAEFQHLLNPRTFVASLGISISDEQRCQLLREAASALAFLHKNGVSVGDISPKNLLFSLNPPAVHFIDCDAMRVNGTSVLPQADTPNWWTPDGEEKATPQTDTYKLGLLALRLFGGEQHLKTPDSLPNSTPPLLRQLITDTLTREPAKRPPPIAWTYILGRAIEDLQHQAAITPPPAPVAAPPHAPAPQPHAIDHTALTPTPIWPPTQSVSYPPGSVPKSGNRPLKVLGLAVTVAAAILVALIYSNSRPAHNKSTPTTTPETNLWSPTFTRTETTTPTTEPTTTTVYVPPIPPPSQPHWDGIWLRNYWESHGDCNSPHGYWVVQPPDDTTPAGMSQLKTGCFPENWINSLNNHGRSFTWGSANVLFAVWDPDRIMSEYNKHGDLQMLGLNTACLARARITDFHEGPIHDDCLVRPSA